jgi:hypothetical protein
VVTITRPAAAAISGSLFAEGTPGAEGPAPCEPNCLNSRQILVVTPPAGAGLITMVITLDIDFKPPAVAYHFNDATQLWETVGKCKGRRYPCVSRVDIGQITVLTNSFSHWK